MSIKFAKIVAGETLLDVHRVGMGNTTMSEWGCWKVVIVSLDPHMETARVSWNGNRTEVWDKRRLEKLYRKEPKALRDQEARRKQGHWL